jgi:hypothetical protein
VAPPVVVTPRPARRNSAAGWRELDAPPAGPATIDIVIDRIDVRLPAAPARAAVRTPQAPAPRLGLAEYLESKGAP